MQASRSSITPCWQASSIEVSPNATEGVLSAGPSVGWRRSANRQGGASEGRLLPRRDQTNVLEQSFKEVVQILSNLFGGSAKHAS